MNTGTLKNTETKKRVVQWKLHFTEAYQGTADYADRLERAQSHAVRTHPYFSL